MFVQGIAKALAHVLPSSELQLMKGVKETGQGLFAPDRGGSLEIWRKRPLPQALVDYCSQDVVHLVTMLDKWAHCLPRSALRTVSELRMAKHIRSAKVETGPGLARKDFHFPQIAGSKPVAKTAVAKPTSLKLGRLSGNLTWQGAVKAKTWSAKAGSFSNFSPAKAKAGASPTKLKPTFQNKALANQPKLRPTTISKDAFASKAKANQTLISPVTQQSISAASSARAVTVEPEAKRPRTGSSSFQ
jgi:hypothetical protein